MISLVLLVVADLGGFYWGPGPCRVCRPIRSSAVAKFLTPYILQDKSTTYEPHPLFAKWTCDPKTGKSNQQNIWPLDSSSMTAQRLLSEYSASRNRRVNCLHLLQVLNPPSWKFALYPGQRTKQGALLFGLLINLDELPVMHDVISNDNTVDMFQKKYTKTYLSIVISNTAYKRGCSPSYEHLLMDMTRCDIGEYFCGKSSLYPWQFFRNKQLINIVSIVIFSVTYDGHHRILIICRCIRFAIVNLAFCVIWCRNT